MRGGSDDARARASATRDLRQQPADQWWGESSRSAPQLGVAGRRIRWGTAGRAAAIGAAGIAAIFSLPALLGNDRPPPVPDDVGLVPPPAAAPTPPAPIQSAIEPLGPEPSTAPRPVKVHKPANGRSHHRRGVQRHDRHPQHPRNTAHKHPAISPAQSAPPSPTYVPAYPPPPARGEFAIEAP